MHCNNISLSYFIFDRINDQTSFKNIKIISNQPQTFELFSLYKVYNESNLFLYPWKEKYATLTHNNPEREKPNHIFGVSKIFDQE